MIKEKILMPGIRYRMKNGSNVSLQVIVDAITQKAREYQIPVSFKSEQITPDFIAGLLGGKEDCIVLFHPQNEKNYLRYVIRVNHQGTYAFITVNKTNGFAPDSAISAGIEAARTVTAHIENNWYRIIDDILEEIFP